MSELDISASANEVVTLLRQGQAREAAARLDEIRKDQPAVIKEALDRYVAIRGEEQLTSLRRPGAVQTDDAPIVQPLLNRMAGATRPPRLPESEETQGLSQAQQHDVYASIAGARGNTAARTALEGTDRVILGLRDENSTTAARGRGVYDDRVVVLWTDTNGDRHAREFNHATTEPTAQYDEHAKTTPRSPGFEDVAPRVKTEGEDVNGDRIRDLGRLAEGTTEMQPATHPRSSHPDEFALRPSAAAVAAGTGRVERDSNGDGWFDSRDTQGVQNLNDTFKIHRGSNANTDSAGCQTIGGGQYDDFVTTVRGTPGQDRWQYVLTSVAPKQQQDQNIDRIGPPDPANDPRRPEHPDHALQQQISTRLQALGEPYADKAEAYSLSLLYDAKSAGVTRVDQIVTSNATGTRTQGETLFLVQGTPGDPAALRVPVSAAGAADMSVDTSLRRLQEQSSQNPAPTTAAPTQQQDAPAIGGR